MLMTQQLTKNIQIDIKAFNNFFYLNSTLSCIENNKILNPNSTLIKVTHKLKLFNPFYDNGTISSAVESILKTLLKLSHRQCIYKSSKELETLFIHHYSYYNSNFVYFAVQTDTKKMSENFNVRGCKNEFHVVNVNLITK
jgi:hypothetical protein